MIKEDIKAILSENYIQISGTTWVRKTELPPIRPGDIGDFPPIKERPFIVPPSKTNLLSKIKMIIFKRR